jgi:hypothetical protein
VLIEGVVADANVLLSAVIGKAALRVFYAAHFNVLVYSWDSSTGHPENVGLGLASAHGYFIMPATMLRAVPLVVPQSTSLATVCNR